MQSHHPPPLAAPPPLFLSNDIGFAAHMQSLASLLEAQPHILMKVLSPQLAALRADIDSLKTAFASSSSKVEHDISKMSTEFANMKETLSTIVRAQSSSFTTPPTHAESSSSSVAPRMHFSYTLKLHLNSYPIV